MNNSALLWEKFFYYLGIFMLMWLSFLYFGAPAAGDNSEASWAQALGYAFKHNFQAGIDYVFTFGPLGYLSNPQSGYDADLFYLNLIWHVITACFFSLIFMLNVIFLTNRTDKFIYFFLIIVVVSMFYEARYFLAIVAASTLLIIPTPRFTPFLYRALLIVILAWFGVIALTKFTLFILTTAATLTLFLTLLLTRSSRLAFSALLIFTSSLIITWWFTGQALPHLPLFLKQSWLMANHYSEAMSGGLQVNELKLAFIIGSLLLFSLLLSNLSSQFKPQRLLLSGLILLTLFLAWKGGFVRHDSHSRLFFAVALTIPFFIHYSHRFLYPLRYLIILLAAKGLFMTGISFNYTAANFIGLWNQHLVRNPETLFNLSTFKANQDHIVADLEKKHALPKTQQQVGMASLDTLSLEQGVIFLNKFNWQPRPIFQSYAAYSPELLAQNAHFYVERPPEFVLYKPHPIDRHFPLHEDSEVIKILLRDYQPLFVEKTYLLLKRAAQGQGTVTPGKILLTQTLQLNELIDLTAFRDRPWLLSLDIKKNRLGHLSNFLYRLPALFMEIITVEGEKFSYRIIPSIANSAFIVNPLILNQNDLLNWYLQAPLSKVANLRFTLQPEPLLEYLLGNSQVFKPTFTLTLHENSLTPQPLPQTHREELLALSYPLFQTIPYRLSNPHEVRAEQKTPVLMVHAPGKMQFQLTPGNYELTGLFGILEGAYTPPNPYPTDGVHFSITLDDHSILFTQLLDPFSNKQHQGLQTLPTILIQITKSSTVTLSTTPGKANNSQSDWSFWGKIAFKPL